MEATRKVNDEIRVLPTAFFLDVPRCRISLMRLKAAGLSRRRCKLIKQHLNSYCENYRWYILCESRGRRGLCQWQLWPRASEPELNPGAPPLEQSSPSPDQPCTHPVASSGDLKPAKDKIGGYCIMVS